MKTKLIITLLASMYAISMTAADNFYYFKGNKMPLNDEPLKAVVNCPKGQIPQIPSNTGISISKKFNDSNTNIILLDLMQPHPLQYIKKQIAQGTAPLNVMPCYKDMSGNEIVPTGYIYVKLRRSIDFDLLYNAAQTYKCRIIEQNEFMPLWYTLLVYETSGLNPVDVANDIYESGNFEASTPGFWYDPLMISYDPKVLEQWGLYNSQYEDIDISISKAWDYATGRGIKVAVIDQGIELTHDDLVDNLYAKSYDASTKSSPSGVYNTKSKGHGTHCAGIIAAVSNNNIDIAGVAPNAKLISVSADFNYQATIQSQLADAINWSWQNGADVLSCSWGGTLYNEMISNALDNALQYGRENKGCVIVYASGNSPTDKSVRFPANYREEIIAVGNIQQDGTRYYSSCYGENLLVCAPGTNILSTMIGNTTSYKTGTSMACPHVAGIAALILERNPKLSANKVREIIAKSTKKVGNKPYSETKKYGTWNPEYGYGLVDAYKAVINTPK